MTIILSTRVKLWRNKMILSTYVNKNNDPQYLCELEQWFSVLMWRGWNNKLILSTYLKVLKIKNIPNTYVKAKIDP